MTLKDEMIGGEANDDKNPPPSRYQNQASATGMSTVIGLIGAIGSGSDEGNFRRDDPGNVEPHFYKPRHC